MFTKKQKKLLWACLTTIFKNGFLFSRKKTKKTFNNQNCFLLFCFCYHKTKK